MTSEQVEDALHRAILTLDAVMDPDRRYVRNRTTRWPEVKSEMQEAYGWEPVRRTRYEPTRRDIDCFLDILDWIKLADAKQHYALLRQRAYGASWRRIADRRGRSDQYWRRRYRDVVGAITEAVNRAGLGEDGAAKKTA